MHTGFDELEVHVELGDYDIGPTRPVESYPYPITRMFLTQLLSSALRTPCSMSRWMTPPPNVMLDLNVVGEEVVVPCPRCRCPCMPLHSCPHTKTEAVVPPRLHAVSLHAVRRWLLLCGECGGDEDAEVERGQEHGAEDGINDEF